MTLQRTILIAQGVTVALFLVAAGLLFAAFPTVTGGALTGMSDDVARTLDVTRTIQESLLAVRLSAAMNSATAKSEIGNALVLLGRSLRDLDTIEPRLEQAGASQPLRTNFLKLVVETRTLLASLDRSLARLETADPNVPSGSVAAASSDLDQQATRLREQTEQLAVESRRQFAAREASAGLLLGWSSGEAMFLFLFVVVAIQALTLWRVHRALKPNVREMERCELELLATRDRSAAIHKCHQHVAELLAMSDTFIGTSSDLSGSSHS